MSSYQLKYWALCNNFRPYIVMMNYFPLPHKVYFLLNCFLNCLMSENFWTQNCLLLSMKHHSFCCFILSKPCPATESQESINFHQLFCMFLLFVISLRLFPNLNLSNNSTKSDHYFPHFFTVIFFLHIFSMSSLIHILVLPLFTSSGLLPRHRTLHAPDFKEDS